MTNRERLISLLGFSPTKETVEGEMLDAGIDPEALYVKESSKGIKKCAINILEILLSTANTTNENGYRIDYDRDAIEKRIEKLKLELEISVSSRPTIKSVKFW